LLELLGSKGTVVLVRCSFLFLSAFVWLLGSSLSTFAVEWKQQSYPDDGFQVEFSAPVAVTETAMSDETKSRIVRATNYLQENGTSAYFVAAMLMKDSVNFDGGTADLFLASKCQAKKENAGYACRGRKGPRNRGIELPRQWSSLRAEIFPTRQMVLSSHGNLCR
jgi:hypothetical protein